MCFIDQEGRVPSLSLIFPALGHVIFMAEETAVPEQMNPPYGAEIPSFGSVDQL